MKFISKSLKNYKPLNYRKNLFTLTPKASLKSDFYFLIRKKIEDKMSVFKILGSLVCLIFAGIMLANITGEELRISDSDDHELSSEN